MTTAQRKGFNIVIAFVGMALTVAFSAGVARRELDAKEDRDLHTRDIVEIRGEILDEKQKRALQLVRDSARMEAVLDRVTDLACERNPRRSYCGR